MNTYHRVLKNIFVHYMTKNNTKALVKISNNKHQITSKLQIPISNDQNSFDRFIFRYPEHVWDFEFRSRAAQALAPRVVICLVFDICDLEFPVYPG